MRTRIWIGLLALTLSAGVGAAGVMVVAERALAPATTPTTVAGPETPAGAVAPSPSESPVPAVVPEAFARTVLLPPAMTPIDPDAPAPKERTTCCAHHREQDPERVPRQC